MIVYGEWPYSELVDQIAPDSFGIILKTKHKTFNANSSSSRLICLKLNNKCVDCRIVGTVWRLESSSPTDERPHINLYAVKDSSIPIDQLTDNDIVLMTKDHILPKSQGGRENQSNLQTMCIECNMRKANRHIRFSPVT